LYGDAIFGVNLILFRLLDFHAFMFGAKNRFFKDYLRVFYTWAINVETYKIFRSMDN